MRVKDWLLIPGALIISIAIVRLFQAWYFRIKVIERLKRLHTTEANKLRKRI